MTDQTRIWQRFAERYHLTSEQLAQFQRYYAMLMAANKEYDLTAITDFESILAYHFADSLEIGSCFRESAWFDTTLLSQSHSPRADSIPAHPECSEYARNVSKGEAGNPVKITPIEQMHAIADVGTGAGFPGLALKIRYPHLQIVLIEVLQKRINFLQSVIDDLQLTNISIYSHDWRTFLRKTDYKLDLICSRASLHPAELLRMFQPSSPYKNALLAYWASQEWQPTEKEAAHSLKTCEYKVKDRTRKYVIFKA